MMSVGEISENHEIVISNSCEIFVGNVLCNDNISRALQFFGVHSLHEFVNEGIPKSTDETHHFHHLQTH